MLFCSYPIIFTLSIANHQKADWKSNDFVGRVQRHSNRHTPKGSASCVQSFDDSLDIQFALRIAFRCVLHRCENRDIHGYQLFGGFCMFCGQQRMTSIKVMGSGFEFREPPSVYRGEVSLRRRVSKRASPFTPLRCVCLSEPRP